MTHPTQKNPRLALLPRAGLARVAPAEEEGSEERLSGSPSASSAAV